MTKFQAFLLGAGSVFGANTQLHYRRVLEIRRRQARDTSALWRGDWEKLRDTDDEDAPLELETSTSEGRLTVGDLRAAKAVVGARQ